MKYRKLGKTGFTVSEISIGTWQVGGKWGEPFSHENADQILNAALDTADVYGDGESEKAVGRVVKSRSERVYIATKCGRRLSPPVNEAYTPKALRQFVEASLANTGLETLDLIQLHCPPTEVYYRPEIFELFNRLKTEGKIQHLGVSVEKVEEALKAIEFPNVTTVQIIFNLFRQRPAELFFREAQRRDVGVIVRVPLASGLLTGKFRPETSFAPDDHRNFNRHGEAFDKGETFAGIDYNTGLAAVAELKKLFPGQENLAPVALRWILQFEAVSCIIPGASHPGQLTSNRQAAAVPDLTPEQQEGVKAIHEAKIKPLVHDWW